MKDDNINNSYEFHELQWDTEFFGVTSAKAVLHKTLKQNEWNELKRRVKEYQFISIENCNSEPLNAQMIGTDTRAFLVDVNVQFIKKLRAPCEIPMDVKIYQSLVSDERIVEMAEFAYSKFKEDPELAKRGGVQVYRQWLMNAFGKQDKFFAIAEDKQGGINGFLLHSYSNNTCTIELIAVSRNATKSGIGTNLFKAVEYAASQRGCEEIKVGTQMRNMGAINFYNKVGCKQVGCHQVYHLWNLK